MDPGRLHFAKVQLNDECHTMAPIRQEILDWIDESLKGRTIPYPNTLSEKEKDDTSLFFHLLHHDVRRLVYDQILGCVGTRVHVTDSGPKRARPLMAIMCDDESYEKCLSCGHEACEKLSSNTGSQLQEPIDLSVSHARSNLETMTTLMKMSKAAYEPHSHLR